MKTHKIVILGAGFGGLATALQLEKRCGRIGECEILLIDREAEHLYTPLLYEVASGFLTQPGKVCRGELRQGVCINWQQYRTIIGSRRIGFKRGQVVGLDAAMKQVILQDGERVAYDSLVVALGSETNDFGIKGLATHAFALKSLGDAFRLRDRIYGFLEKYRQGNEEHLSIVVGGAGATGTEFAAETAHHFGQLQRAKILRPGSWSVTLVDLVPDVLMAFPDGLRVRALRRLKSLGVVVWNKTAVKEVMAGLVTVDQEGQISTLEADVMVWCGGIKPASILSQLSLPLGPKGHLDVDEMLRVRGCADVYALGDCAQVKAQEGYVPALAVSAIKEAAALAENLVRRIEQRPLLPWKSPTDWPTIVPLGGQYALAKIGPIRVEGFPAYLLRKGADLRYWLSILPLHFALHVWLRGAKTYIKND